MKCVSKSGVCPVLGCDEDGECYLWRCDNQDAPKPVSDDELLARFAALVLKVIAAREVA